MALTFHQFQYRGLSQYSQHIWSAWKAELKKRCKLESAYSTDRKQWRRQDKEMKERIATLEKLEAKLNKWEQRRGMISHYLGLVTRMAESVLRNPIVDAR